MRRTQPDRSQIDQAPLAAVRVENDELANAGASDVPADLEPGFEQGFRFERESARKVRMFRACAEIERRQEQGGDVVRHGGQRGPHNTLVDQRIRGERQMRPVLLDRGDGEYGHRSLRIEPGEIGRLEFLPIA